MVGKIRFLIPGLLFVSLFYSCVVVDLNSSSLSSNPSLSSSSSSITPSGAMPVVTFKDGVEVSGSVLTMYNGTYLFSGSNDNAGTPCYSNQNGLGFIGFEDTNSCGNWFMGSNSTGDDPASRNTSPFRFNYAENNNISGVWQHFCNNEDDSLPPMVRVLGSISGHRYVGQTVTGAEYNYTNADNIPEGASTYKWYRCNDTNDTGVLINGADSDTYVISSADAGKYLLYVVTPVSVSNMAGAPITSDYFGPISALPASYTVSGAGTNEANGTYNFAGFYNSRPYFKNTLNDHCLVLDGCNSVRWGIMEKRGRFYDGNHSYGFVYRSSDGGDYTNALPPANYESGCYGADPAPTVTANY